MCVEKLLNFSFSISQFGLIFTHFRDIFESHFAPSVEER